MIVYLNPQGSNLPLPAAPAAARGSGRGGDQRRRRHQRSPMRRNAVDAIADGRRGQTAIADAGTPASGAPSVDPEAARNGGHGREVEALREQPVAQLLSSGVTVHALSRQGALRRSGSCSARSR